MVVCRRGPVCTHDMWAATSCACSLLVCCARGGGYYSPAHYMKKKAHRGDCRLAGWARRVRTAVRYIYCPALLPT